MQRLAQIIVVCAVVLLTSTGEIWGVDSQSPRQVLAADSDWKFFLGDPPGAEAPSFADHSWRTVDLPHDWSIESQPDNNNPTGRGGGFFPAGIGWYRKRFESPAGWKGKRVIVEFDGVYRNGTVYLNGHKLGMHPYGYTSFTFDLTPNLNLSGENILAVRVDNSAQPNSRWYSGSGIYRHVRVVVTAPTHVAQWGVYVTTHEVSTQSAQVVLRTRVANDTAQPAALTLQTTLFDKAGNQVGSARSKVTIAPAKEREASQELTVANPGLWSPDSPTMYRAVSQILKDGALVDEVSTPFGIRSLTWSAEKGLLLNGKAIKLTGGSVHHDNGPLGAAAFDRAEERRVELLKAAGQNAVRTAHNPPSPAFLEACDRLGLLVLDEPFDVWTIHKEKFDYASDFEQWWKQDLSSMVLRDRNHPSIVIWGIGNEIPELELEKGRAIAKPMVDLLRSLDNTRPVTLAFPGKTMAPNAQAVFSLLDITGYNYNIQSYKEDHSQLPSRIMLTTESFPAELFHLWQISEDNPFVLGDLTWTAMDYLGESGIGAWSEATPEQAKLLGPMTTTPSNNTEMGDQFLKSLAQGVDFMQTIRKNNDPAVAAAMALMFHNFPWHAAACGDLDLTGYRKPQSYYRDITWNGGDRVYATVRLPEPEGKKIIATRWTTYPTISTWTWPGQEGKELQVEVYSRTEKVQLFLNDKLIGDKPTGRDQEFKATFSVPYTPGTLKAVGYRDGRAVAEHVLTTAGNPVSLRLIADRTTVQADGEDLSFVAVEAVDSEGRLQTTDDQEVQFSINGPGSIAAVGNGDGQDDASYHGDRRKLFQGRALVVVRTSRQAGPIKLTARTSGLRDASMTIEAKAAQRHPELKN